MGAVGSQASCDWFPIHHHACGQRGSTLGHQVAFKVSVPEAGDVVYGNKLPQSCLESVWSHSKLILA